MRLQSGQTGYLDGSCLGTQTLPHRATTGRPVARDSRYGPWIHSAQNDRRRHHRRAPAIPWSPDAPARRFRHPGRGCAAVRRHRTNISAKVIVHFFPRKYDQLHPIIDSRRKPRNPLARNPHTSTHPCRASRHPACHIQCRTRRHTDATSAPHTLPAHHSGSGRL